MWNSFSGYHGENITKFRSLILHRQLHYYTTPEQLTYFNSIFTATFCPDVQLTGLKMADLPAYYNETLRDHSTFEDTTQRVVIALIMCIISLVGIVGNTVVILAVILSRKLRSSTNLFILNLACADLLTCLTIPFHVVALLSRNGWPLSPWICSGISLISFVCGGASITTLALIAYNRWYLLTHTRSNFRRFYRRRNTCAMVVIAWMYPFILTVVPIASGLGRLGYSNKDKICTQDSEWPTARFFSLITGVGVIIPTSVAILVIYAQIYQLVSKHNKRMSSPDCGATSSGADDHIDTNTPVQTKCTQNQQEDQTVDIKSNHEQTAIRFSKRMAATHGNHQLSSSQECAPPCVAANEDTNKDTTSWNVGSFSRTTSSNKQIAVSHGNRQGTPSKESASPCFAANENSNEDTSGIVGSVSRTTSSNNQMAVSHRNHQGTSSQQGAPPYGAANEDTNADATSGSVGTFSRITSSILEPPTPSASVTPHNLSIQERRFSRHHVNVTKRLSIVVLAYFICFLPFCISVFLPSGNSARLWALSVAAVNNCINPIIYARTMPVFREVMGCIIRCRLGDIPKPIPCIRK